jgi:DNA-binding NtrC family response regulator
MDRRKRILLLDDDDRVRFVLADILRKLGSGFEVVAASSCREALSLAQETDFDLLITDLRLPRSDGLALTSAFAKVSPNTKVVWITAHGCHHYLASAKRLDVVRCLDKPLDIQSIRAAALDVLRNGHNGK